MPSPMLNPLFGQLAPSLALSALAYAALVLVPVCALGILLHYVLSLPMRRRERARFFLDLLETALQRGESPERVLVSMAASQDRSPGVRFHLLAAYLEGGDDLGTALDKVPRLLPPQVTEILKAGQRMGDLRSVVPACREIVRDSQSSVRSAESYAMVLLLTLSPLAVWVTWLLFTFVVPKLKAILEDFEGEVPRLASFVWNHAALILVPQTLLFVFLLFVSFLHIAGPRATRWFNWGPLDIADWLAWRIPWKRQRLQRTFSRMLAAFLDARMPESAAVQLAADCTANRIFRRRAAQATADLAQGVKLADALKRLDDHGEFRWRLRNALYSGSAGFLKSLRGWHEMLEARAFRGEQTAAHVVTTGLVLLNGVLVALIALATFGSLIAILDAGALW